MSSSLTAFSADFLRRSLRMTAALTLLGSLWVLTYWGLWPALALLSGGAWGLVNILLIKRSVELLVTPGKVDRVAVWGMMLIKFPALYFAGYGLLSFERFEVSYLLAGFSTFFVVVALKAIGRALLKMDDKPQVTKRESVLG